VVMSHFLGTTTNSIRTRKILRELAKFAAEAWLSSLELAGAKVE
jgi:hypothetical protein